MPGLLGLRIFETTGADIADLGEEHGHRVLRVCGKGTKTVLIPLPAAVERAIDRSIGTRTDGPILLNSRGARMDRHVATRRLRRLAETAGVRITRPHPHMLRHTFVTTMQGRGVASDATFRAWHEDGAVRDAGPSAAGQRSRRPGEPAGQGSRDRTLLSQMPGCCIHSRCIKVQHDAARATKKRSDEGRCHHRPVVALTYSAWLVNRSLPVWTLAWLEIRVTLGDRAGQRPVREIRLMRCLSLACQPIGRTQMRHSARLQGVSGQLSDQHWVSHVPDG